ncbi:MAG TPA: hypothetical protein VFN10_07125 [Thermoanaerobaculia bacterium]|nr:hypothetical protein [Thermoanaerobaculia bacterium]
MTRRRRSLLLAIQAGVAALALLVFLLNRDLALAQRPKETAGLTRWIAKHPADWIAASKLADDALDSELPSRVRVWNASHALASYLAPRRPNPNLGYVRAGMFHWYELSDAERRDVIAAAAPLLRDPKLFFVVYRPLWNLTGDLTIFRRANPGTIEAYESLRDLAVANGNFEQYRQLREIVRAKQLTNFIARAPELDPAELSNALPIKLYDTKDEPLMRRYLALLHERPLASAPANGNAFEPLLEYALEHDLTPLDGLETVIRSDATDDALRARLALQLDDRATATELEMTRTTRESRRWTRYFADRAVVEAQQHDAHLATAYVIRAAEGGMNAEALRAEMETAAILGNDAGAKRARAALANAYAKPGDWSGFCVPREICARASAVVYAASFALPLEVVQSDDVAPYVEIYVDDVLVEEGEVRGKRMFQIDLGDAPAFHRIDVRLANPRTRNQLERRVRLS